MLRGDLKSNIGGGWLRESISYSGTLTPRNKRSGLLRKSVKQKMTKEETKKDIIDNFLENTQITWIYYVSTRRGLWRLVWIMIILSGIAMALVQSRKALTGYAGYDVSLQTTYLLNSTLPFPAVTICSNSPIDWLNEEIHNSTLYQELSTRLRNDNERIKYNSKYKKKGKPFEEYLLFDVLRKFPVSLSTYGVVQSIDWNGTRYTADGRFETSFEDLKKRKIVKLMKSLYYGDCFTFNAGVDSEEHIIASALTGIQFTLDWDSKLRYPYLSDPAVVFVVHPSGTAPILGDGTIFKVYSKDEVTVGIKKRNIERLPAPYPSHCVENDQYPLRSNSVYYSNESRYLYSIDACINTCLQRLSLQICGCWDYTIPVGLLENTTLFQTASICASRCSVIDSALNLQTCKCNLPCKESSLQLSFSVKSNLVTNLISGEFKNTSQLANIETTNFPTVNEVKKTTLKVFLKTSVYEYSNEVPRYTVADFWGIVGGNAAFWIGISAVSFFELIELAALLIINALKGVCPMRTTTVWSKPISGNIG